MTLRNYTLAQLFERLILPALWETLYMVALAGMMAIIIGLLIGVILFVTDKEGLRPNRSIYNVVDGLINIVRSFPFTILMISIIPITRSIVGTSLGVNAALVPLTITNSSFMARIYQNSFNEVDKSLIEAARSFDLKDSQIVVKFVLSEAVPAIVSGISLGIISLLSQTAAAGAIGAGGLGATAIQYGYQSFNNRVMYSIVVVLIVLVAIIQLTGNFLYKKLK